MRKTTLSLCGIFCATLLVIQGCATTKPINPILMAKQIETEKTLTKDAFLRVESFIKDLRPAQSISSTNLKWPIYPVKLGGKVVGVCALSDGWAGDISGNEIGAAFKLGLPFAYKDNFIWRAYLRLHYRTSIFTHLFSTD
jgi:hypothetical protein